MARDFDFKTAQKEEAFVRQQGRCACCGDGLADHMDNAHHVIPNQTGDKQKAEDAFIQSKDNCVYLCEPCHQRVHENGKWNKGAVAPPEYYPYSHGQNEAAHKDWCKTVNAEWDRRFPQAAKDKATAESRPGNSRAEKAHGEYAENRKRRSGKEQQHREIKSEKPEKSKAR